jgi:SAM-dependent methyltransferase
MTVISETQNKRILTFDSMAARYDDLFTHSEIGRTQREAIGEVLINTFRPGDHILELNCGTGEEALFLGLYSDVAVLACDASERTIRAAQLRKQADAPDVSVQFELLSTEHLSKLSPGALFDGALLNLSGLNSVTDLNRTARDLASLVAIGAPVLICLSTRFCLSETLWFLVHGKFRRAFRRSAGIATVKVGDEAAKVNYPTLGEVKKLFSPSFVMRSRTGLGVVAPPSYLERHFRKYPRVLWMLRLIDRRISRIHSLQTIGDHMLLCFERVEG